MGKIKSSRLWYCNLRLYFKPLPFTHVFHPKPFAHSPKPFTQNFYPFTLPYMVHAALHSINGSCMFHASLTCSMLVLWVSHWSYVFHAALRSFRWSCIFLTGLVYFTLLCVIHTGLVCIMLQECHPVWPKIHIFR